jgi:CheY-like chemotaxis protein
MSKTGPIIIIDDDPDDQDLICRVLQKLDLGNRLLKFQDGEEALDYFLHMQEDPMVILCDINMPLMNGFDLKKNIESNENLRRKKMPFVYLTTTASPDQVKQAYQLMINGFFVKGQSYAELKDTVIHIVNYWKKCEHPNLTPALS